MRMWYPHLGYEARSDSLAKASTYAPLAIAAASSDRGGVVQEGLKAFAPQLIDVAHKLVRKNPTPGPPRRAPPQEARARAYQLIVMRTNRHLPWKTTPPHERAAILAALRETAINPANVTEGNCYEWCMNLLKTFYPAAYAAEKELFLKRAQTRKPAAVASSPSTLTSPLPLPAPE